MLMGTASPDIQHGRSSRDTAPEGPGGMHRGLTGIHILHSTWKQGSCTTSQKL